MSGRGTTGAGGVARDGVASTPGPARPGVAERVLRLPATIASPPGALGALSVLIYHRVLPQPDPLYPWAIDADTFRWQMRLLARVFRVLPLADAVTRLKSGRLPARAVCVTFDDGYADNAEVALPILRETGVHATFFVATGYLDGGHMWNDDVIEAVARARGPGLAGVEEGEDTLALATDDDRRRAVAHLVGRWKYLDAGERARRAEALLAANDVAPPRHLMMRGEQVRALHGAGMGIGAHTVTHPILAGVGDAEAREEIGASREHLESLVGERVRLFAYPNGNPARDYTAAQARLVRSLGFDAAMSTAWGVGTRRCDPYQLPRFTPWDRSPSRFALRLVRNCLSRSPATAD